MHALPIPRDVLADDDAVVVAGTRDRHLAPGDVAQPLLQRRDGQHLPATAVAQDAQERVEGSARRLARKQAPGMLADAGADILKVGVGHRLNHFSRKYKQPGTDKRKQFVFI